MAECSNACSQQTAEINNLNAKLAYDSSAQLQHQSLVDNQNNARGWAALELKTAQDAQTASALAQINAVISAQVSNIETQQTTSPIRTGSGDAIAAVPGVAAGQVSANIADVATLAKAIIAQTFAAVLPVLVNASGGASTPSQTQPKPTGAA